MKILIRTGLLSLIFVIFKMTSFAGPYSGGFLLNHPKGYFIHLRKLDSTLHQLPQPGEERSVIKVCSCQILNLKSNNYQQHDIAVFAERSSRGHYSNDLLLANRTIEKEKKHIKQLFFDHLQVVDRYAENTDCKSLYLRLKQVNGSLAIYDILDADQSRR
jgi:hypothetical protein